MNWRERIEFLTDGTTHLSYICSLADTYDLPSDLREDINNETTYINKRLSDNNLYVAVVGRASTGKSTFINALLRDNLLDAKVLTMTTAAATFVCYDDELSLKVRIKNLNLANKLGLDFFSKKGSPVDDKEILSNTVSLDETILCKFTTVDEPITFDGRVVGIRELIRILTTSDEYASQIASIIIGHPAPLLKTGIVIIDTPGADATQPIHKEITRRAVERADGAVIITPGEQTISNWLIETLRDSNFIAPLLQRCVFMITRMDIAQKRLRNKGRDEAINEIYQDAVQRLKSGLKSVRGYDQEPKIYYSAAQAIIDDINEEEVENLNFWLEEFKKFEDDFISHLAYQRAEAIAGNILRLLEKLFVSLESHLSLIWRDFDEKSKQFEEIIGDLDSFCISQKKQCKVRIDRRARDAKDKVSLTIINERNRQIRHIKRLIYDANSMDALKSKLDNDEINKILSKSARNANSSLVRQAKQIHEEALKVNQSFEEKFNEIYSQLQLLDIEAVLSPNKNLSLEISGSSVSFSNRELVDENSTEKFAGGAIAGAIIGSIIPGVGTLFGAIVGGLLSSIFGGPSLDSVKDKIWSELQPQLQSFYDGMLVEAKDSTKKTGKKTVKKIQKRIDDHSTKYAATVDHVRAEQLKQKNELNNKQALLESELEQLKKQRFLIQDQKEKLQLNQDLNRIGVEVNE